MNLITLAAFQQIVEHGGVSRASRAVPVPKTTLSRRLRELEASLGTRLIERGPRLFRLTNDGTALFERTRTLLAEIDEVGQSLQGGLSQPRGPLRVSAPAQFTDFHLSRLIPEFVARYPEIVLEVVSDDRLVNPLLEGFDMVVRVNPSRHEDMIGRLLFREETLLVATSEPPEPTAESPTPIRVVALPFPGTDRPWTVDQDGKQRTFQPNAAVRLSSIPAARVATLAGVGAALLPGSAVAADLASGALRCWGRLPARPIELWVLYRSRQLRGSKVAVFVDYLCEALANPGIAPSRSNSCRSGS